MGMGSYNVPNNVQPQQSYFNPMTMGLLAGALKNGMQGGSPNPQIPMAGDANQDPNGGQNVGYGLGQQVVGQYPGAGVQVAQSSQTGMPSPYADPNLQGQNPLLQALMRQKSTGVY